MEYYIFTWDMQNSTELIKADEAKTLQYLGLMAQFCLKLTSELTDVEVSSIGDGQQVYFPKTDKYSAYVGQFAEDVISYAKSLQHQFPSYAIHAGVCAGTLHGSPLGKKGAVLWEINSALKNSPPNELLTLVSWF